MRISVRRLNTLVSTKWLKDQIKLINVTATDKLKILDTSWLPEKSDEDGFKTYYLDGHIPESSYFNLQKCLRKTEFVMRDIPDTNVFVDHVQELGVCRNTHVIVYDRFHCMSTVRTWWMFRFFGHENISILNGGMRRWVLDGYETSNSVPEVKRGDFTAKVTPSLLRRYDDMVENVWSHKEQVLDARGENLFLGIQKMPEGMQSGHIKGAKNINYDLLFNEDSTFKSEKDIKNLFNNEGIHLNKPLVTSCLTGITACGLAAAAHILGKKDVSVYVGSWKEYGTRSPPKICETNID